MLDIGRGYDAWVGCVARVWSLKEGKNMCHIYTHYLTWQRSVHVLTREQGYKMQVHIGAHFVV